jgi:GTP1/Obg family GTP-binding protein
LNEIPYIRHSTPEVVSENDLACKIRGALNRADEAHNSIVWLRNRLDKIEKWQGIYGRSWAELQKIVQGEYLEGSKGLVGSVNQLRKEVAECNKAAIRINDVASRQSKYDAAATQLNSAAERMRANVRRLFDIADLHEKVLDKLKEAKPRKRRRKPKLRPPKKAVRKRR